MIDVHGETTFSQKKVMLTVSWVMKEPITIDFLKKVKL